MKLIHCDLFSHISIIEIYCMNLVSVEYVTICPEYVNISLFSYMLYIGRV